MDMTTWHLLVWDESRQIWHCIDTTQAYTKEHAKRTFEATNYVICRERHEVVRWQSETSVVLEFEDDTTGLTV